MRVLGGLMEKPLYMDNCYLKEFEATVEFVKDDKYVILDKTLDPAKIVNFIKATFKLHPSVLKIQKVDSIPLTQNGKPDYQCLYKSI